MTTASVVRALFGGALIGLAATIALLAHGRIAGVCGILARALDRDGGSGFRVPFLLALVAVGVIAFVLMPAAFGVPVRGTPTIALSGLLVGVGTTLANGCTSGHGVCGLSRLSPRSLVAVLVFMSTAAITVALVGAHS